MFPTIADRWLKTSWLWRPTPKKRPRRSQWGSSETLEIRAVPAVDLAGAWQIDGQATSITQVGTVLTFTNENGTQSSGTLVSDTQVTATDWGNLNGTVNASVDTITWANGTIWTRATLTAPDISGTYTFNGQTTTVAQNGTSLIFTNENGSQSTGTFIN